MRRPLTILFLLTGACAAPGAPQVSDSPQVSKGECADGVCPLPESYLASAVADWTVADMDGSELDLSASLAEGKKVGLVFWQTWCRSCREEFPDLVRAAREHAGELELVGVVSGPDEFVDDAEVRRVAVAAGLPYPQVRDRELSLTRAFEVEGTPTIIVLGEGKSVLYRGHESPDWATLLR